MMNCVEIQDLFSAYLDHECTPEENELVKSHLENCKACLEQFEWTKALVEKLNNFEEQEIPDGFHEKLMHKIHELSPNKKNIFAKFRRNYSFVAAAFLFCLIFGVIGSGLLMNFANQKTEDKVLSKSEATQEQTMEAPQIAYNTAVTSQDSPNPTSANKEMTPELKMADETTDATLDSDPTTNADSTSDITFDSSAAQEPSVSGEYEMAVTGTEEVPENTEADMQVKSADIATPSAEKNSSLQVDSSDQTNNNQEQIGYSGVNEDEGNKTLTYLIIVVALVILLVPIIVFLWIRKKH